ncbi:MAG: type II toxin-antitoxin system Phd/YefM family antitoxin [Firmicutes bacterium]|nr:type II toxin-antitoxin system Phd/YefM family antitoxin [Bacillota bacterium]
MAKIIPIRDLRKGAEISEYVKKSGEPIYVTRNGYGDMVILSMDAYEKQFAEGTAYTQILDSLEEVRNGARPIPIDDAFACIEAKYVKQ